MSETFDDVEFIKNSFEQYDDTFTWYIPGDDEKENILAELKKETADNQHLHINKYKDSAIVLCKHKQRNDVLFLLAGGECVIVHLTYDNSNSEDKMHFLFFSNVKSSMKYIMKQYRIEFLGEKDFVLTSKDKTEIILFALQFILFWIVPATSRGLFMVVSGIILYAVILNDWKENGFNIIRDRKLEHTKVIPLLKYQIAYIVVMTIFLVIGIALLIITGIMID